MPKDNGLRKKRREDLLLIIRELVEENEALKAQLSEAQAVQEVCSEPPQSEIMAMDESLIGSLNRLRASVDACTSAVLALNQTKTENA